MSNTAAVLDPVKAALRTSKNNRIALYRDRVQLQERLHNMSYSMLFFMRCKLQSDGFDLITGNWPPGRAVTAEMKLTLRRMLIVKHQMELCLARTLGLSHEMNSLIHEVMVEDEEEGAL